MVAAQNTNMPKELFFTALNRIAVQDAGMALVIDKIIRDFFSDGDAHRVT